MSLKSINLISKKVGGDNEMKLFISGKKSQTHGHKKIPLTLRLMLQLLSKLVPKVGRSEVVFSSQSRKDLLSDKLWLTTHQGVKEAVSLRLEI